MRLTPSQRKFLRAALANNGNIIKHYPVGMAARFTAGDVMLHQKSAEALVYDLKLIEAVRAPRSGNTSLFTTGKYRYQLTPAGRAEAERLDNGGSGCI